jgi:hypothetical protein
MQVPPISLIVQVDMLLDPMVYIGKGLVIVRWKDTKWWPPGQRCQHPRHIALRVAGWDDPI